MENNKFEIQAVGNEITRYLDKQLGTPAGKALLANLRNSIGRPLSSTLAVWPMLYDKIPEKFLGISEKLTKEEKAILAMTQLYALYHQGQDMTLATNEKINLGYSLSALRTATDSKSIDRRFNAMITSTTYDEFIHHLRMMIKLLKSKTKNNVHINFGKLCQDIYWFSRGYEENIRLSWAKAYYSQFNNKGEETNEQE